MLYIFQVFIINSGNSILRWSLCNDSKNLFCGSQLKRLWTNGVLYRGRNSICVCCSNVVHIFTVYCIVFLDSLMDKADVIVVVLIYH